MKIEIRLFLAWYFFFHLRHFSTHIVKGKQHEIVQDWRIPRKEGRSSTPLSTPPLLELLLCVLPAFATTSTQRRIIGENASKKDQKVYIVHPHTNLGNL